MADKKEVSTFEELYLEQKKKNSRLMIAVIVLSITTVGGLMVGVMKSNNGGMQPPGGFQSSNGQGFQGGPGGGMGQMNVKRFFKDDGSVDTDEVKDLLDRSPSGGNSDFLTRFKEGITRAVKNGDITQAQADALIKAIEDAGGTTDAS